MKFKMCPNNSKQNFQINQKLKTMTQTIASKSNTSDRELSITRVLNAPRSLVWKVFTEPEHIKNWWGPDGFNITIDKMEVRDKGHWNLVMHGPDGTDYRNEIVYEEIVKPEKTGTIVIIYS